jgi:iron complex outermembrane receptor protein
MRKITFNWRKLTIAAAGPGLMWSANIACAQIAAATATAAPTSDTLEEVVVTAQKREQSIQAVGTSITAIDGTALAKLGLSDVTSLASQVPGMQFSQFSPTITVFNLRGVSQNDFTDHQEPPVAAYSDDVYVASMGALAGSMFDLERVEVLRGPQGTLFGRNATGGLVQYISQKPVFDDEGNITVTGGNYGTFNSEGALNAKVSDTLALRASFETDHHDGYVQNFMGPDLENLNQYAARLQALFKPSEQGEILLKLYGTANDHMTGAGYSWWSASHPDATGRGAVISNTSTANCPNLDGGCTPGGDLSGYRNTSTSPFGGSFAFPGFFNRTVGGATLHVDWNFDNFSLTSVSDYQHLAKHYGEDSAESPNPILGYFTDQRFSQWSQDLHLNGKVDRLTWIAGVYFLNYHTFDYDTVTAAPLIGGLSEAQYAINTNSQAVFGQLEYAFTDHWTGIAGARYSNDQKTYNYNYTNAPQVPTTYNLATDPNAREDFASGTGKLELDYKFDGESMLYGSVNRGAKPGGWSAPVSGVVDTTLLPFKQETLTSYELGEKLTLWDGRARLNSSVFYYDYRNYQGFFFVGLSNIVKNVNADVKGAEVEFSWIPFHGANLELGVSRLDAMAKSIPLPAGGTTDTFMPQAPNWSINATASYDWSIPTGKLSLETDAKWNDWQYLELTNAPADYEPAYIVMNARLQYSSGDGHWDVSTWVKNLADRWYRVYGLDLSSLGYEQSVYGPPRTFGATVTYHFGP